MRSVLKVLAAAVVATVASGCDKSPTTPTPPPPAPATQALVVVASTKVVGERRAEGGYVYRTVLHLTETAGVTANIVSVNLTFLNGTTALLTARFDAVVPSTGNTCPARSSVDTRELVSTDTTTSHAFATTVRVEVTYGDATATAMTANGTADVPPLGPPPPSTYTLTGRIFRPRICGHSQRARRSPQRRQHRESRDDRRERLGHPHGAARRDVQAARVGRRLQRRRAECHRPRCPAGGLHPAALDRGLRVRRLGHRQDHRRRSRRSIRRDGDSNLGLLLVAGDNGCGLADAAQFVGGRRGHADVQLRVQPDLYRTPGDDYL